MSESLRQLAVAHGIALEFRDARDRVQRAGDETLRSLLRAMQVDAESEDEVAQALLDVAESRCRQCLPPMIVVRSNARPWRISACLHAEPVPNAFAWRIATEDGAARAPLIAAPKVAASDPFMVEGQPFITCELGLDAELPDGYHAIELVDGARPLAQATLAVAPARCYRPASLRAGGRRYGASVQLYSLRSQRNFGIGDFTDLATLVAQCGAAGADIVGVNPLHALFPQRPARASPYSPSSRLFLNVLYLDVQAVTGFDRCTVARERVGSEAFQAALRALRAESVVEYEGVAAAKLEILQLVYAHTRREAAAGRHEHWTAFDAFKTAGGEALRRHALFDALHAHFAAGNPDIWGWPAWPASYHDPQGQAITEFADRHAERVDFYAWLQWQAALQRASVAARARACGLGIGLYADLAVSIDSGGADAWAWRDLYAIGASVGAPPDPFNARGQDWGLPPLVPQRLRDAGYAPFIAVLRANMRDAGALRIDHVMGLLRLYWVPTGAEPARGAYVRYPFEDLLGILALESQRQRCLIIGEDLGTVPDEVRVALAANDVLSYRVLLFERDAEGRFKSPAAYPEAALATASTHDLPTLAGWWEGRDIGLRADHGQLGTGAGADGAMAERVRDRGLLLEALAAAGLLPPGIACDPQTVTQMTPALAEAIHVYLARTSCALFVVQAEDAFGVREQVNLPGTTSEHPNWRRKLPFELEDDQAVERLRALAARIAAERPRP
ncbi:MAG TPA: 4-alpha-glucanotransferase [Casimicrobiaceae bacterium]|nr:4-alpha-glucanotransferase [Casimicrobiaceae bacterium]